MANTTRTKTAALALLADNASGAISPQDLRDALVSWAPGHGQLSVAAANAGAFTISDNTSYFEATAMTWDLTAGAHLFDESGGNGRLTFTGTVPVTAHVACSISMTCGTNNQLSHWRLGLNATPDAASEVQRKIGTGTDSGSTALHLIQTLTAGDYVSLWCRNSTAANDITLEVANLQVVTMPI